MIALRSNGYVDVLRSQWLPADYCKSSISTVSIPGMLPGQLRHSARCPS